MSITNTPRAVLVTGAARGLGAFITERLAHDGYHVFAGARHVETPHTERVTPVTIDVTSWESVAGAVSTVEDQLGDAGLFALVNNAAVLHAGPVEHVTPHELDDQLRANVGGPLMMTQAFLPLLRRGEGRIVNIGSINGQLPLPYWGVYSATKAALLALSDAMRIELAPWKIGVTVLTLGAFVSDIRRRGQAGWIGDVGDVYEQARLANARLVDILDATADDPRLVGEAVIDVLRSEPPPAHVAVGHGVDDLLALAAQPADVRDAALLHLLAGN